jgi:hypothetical protein
VEGLGSLIGLENDGLTVQDKPHREHERYAANHDTKPAQPLRRHQSQALLMSELLECAIVFHVASSKAE